MVAKPISIHRSKRKHDKHAAEWLTSVCEKCCFVKKSCFVDVRKVHQVGVRRLGNLGALGKWRKFEDTSIKRQIFVHIKGK